jgi:hypothetical protein
MYLLYSPGKENEGNCLYQPAIKQVVPAGLILASYYLSQKDHPAGSDREHQNI